MNNIMQLQIGDKILYKGNNKTIWIVEHIAETKVNCSAMLPDTLELIYREFSLTSIEKYIKPTITIGTSNNKNRF